MVNTGLDVLSPALTVGIACSEHAYSSYTHGVSSSFRCPVRTEVIITQDFLCTALIVGDRWALGEQCWVVMMNC